MKNLIILCAISFLIILMFYFMIVPDKGIIKRKVIETREYTETNGETTQGTGQYYKVYYFELNDGGWSGYIDSIEFTKYKVNEFYPNIKK